MCVCVYEKEKCSCVLIDTRICVLISIKWVAVCQMYMMLYREFDV